MDALLPLVTDNTYKRCFFVVDDRSCSDLLREGDIDAVVRKAISRGLEPVRAIQMATINTAEYFRLYDRGAIAPGYIANFITITDLAKLEIDMVFYKGKLVASRGKPLFLPPPVTLELKDTVRLKSPTGKSLKIAAAGETYPVIEIVPGQIVTKKAMEKIKVVDGTVMPDVERDILKLVVVERHKASGNIGVGLGQGIRLEERSISLVSGSRLSQHNSGGRR